LSFINDMP